MKEIPDDLFSNVLANIISAAIIGIFGLLVPIIKKLLIEKRKEIDNAIVWVLRVLEFTFSYLLPIGGIIRLFLMFEVVDKPFLLILMMWAGQLIMNYVRDSNHATRVKTLKSLNEAMERTTKLNTLKTINEAIQNAASK